MESKTTRLLLALSAAVLTLVAQPKGRAQSSLSGPAGPKPPRSLRLYVMDCGTLHGANPARFHLKREEVSTTDMSVGCFLVVHPKGTLVWDTGAVPDSAWKPTGGPVDVHVPLTSLPGRDLTMVKPLNQQLAEIGYAPSKITYLALSHYHWDHTANSNEFAGATWLARQVERDAMFAEKPPALTQPSTYSALRDSKTIILNSDEYDVFGDGTVILKLAPGHTPGHQVLFLKLAKTGPVLLTGDLYHYPEERTLDRLAVSDLNPEQTRASRMMIEAFLKKTGAQIWIEHDFIGNAKLKKSPSFYE